MKKKSIGKNKIQNETSQIFVFIICGILFFIIYPKNIFIPEGTPIGVSSALTGCLAPFG